MAPMTTGKAAVLDLGLGSALAQQKTETEEDRRKRLLTSGMAVQSLLGTGNFGG